MGGPVAVLGNAVVAVVVIVVITMAGGFRARKLTRNHLLNLTECSVILNGALIPLTEATGQDPACNAVKRTLMCALGRDELTLRHGVNLSFLMGTLKTLLGLLIIEQCLHASPDTFVILRLQELKL